MTVLPPIQTLWIGTTLSPLEQLSLASFIAHGHEVILFCYDDIESLPAGVRREDASIYFSRDEVPFERPDLFAVVADIFRYRMLADRGGVWVDADIIALKPFAFSQPLLIASERTPHGDLHITNSVLGGEKGHPFFEACMKVSGLDRWRDLPRGALGPGMVAKLIPALGFDESVFAPEAFCPVPWWEVEKLFSPPAPAIDLSQSRALHFWNEKIRECGISKAAPLPGSWYHRLLSRYGLA